MKFRLLKMLVKSLEPGRFWDIKAALFKITKSDSLGVKNQRLLTLILKFLKKSAF